MKKRWLLLPLALSVALFSGAREVSAQTIKWETAAQSPQLLAARRGLQSLRPKRTAEQFVWNKKRQWKEITLSPDGKRALCLSDFDSRRGYQATIREAKTGRLLVKLKRKYEPSSDVAELQSSQWSRDGRWVAWIEFEGKGLALFNARTGHQVKWRLSVVEERPPIFHPDSRHIAVLNGRRVELRRMVSGRVVYVSPRFPKNNPVLDAFSRDGKFLWVRLAGNVDNPAVRYRVR